MIIDFLLGRFQAWAEASAELELVRGSSSAALQTLLLTLECVKIEFTSKIVVVFKVEDKISAMAKKWRSVSQG
jgi:hypothetical protein